MATTPKLTILTFPQELKGKCADIKCAYHSKKHRPFIAPRSRRACLCCS